MVTPEELLSTIRTEYEKRRGDSPTLRALLEKVQAGRANYLDAHEYAYDVGAILSKIFGETITVDVLPDGMISFDDALKVIGESLRMNFDDVSGVTMDIQRSLNMSAGLGLRPVSPQLNEARIKGMSTLISSGPVDQVMDELKTAIETFSEHTVDDAIKVNADRHYQAGLRPRIIRKAEPGCCKWCSDLTGEYEYPIHNDDVFRRHQRCRCTTEYDPGDGSNKRQNVWNQSEWRTI